MEVDLFLCCLSEHFIDKKAKNIRAHIYIQCSPDRYFNCLEDIPINSSVASKGTGERVHLLNFCL